MKITGFIWLEEVVEKLAAKHQVGPEDVEELFRVAPKFRFVERGHQENEDLYAALGQTESGRYMVTFFIRKTDGRALPLSARDMTPAERKLYGRK